jgi:hypothetical protein
VRPQRAESLTEDVEDEAHAPLYRGSCGDSSPGGTGPQTSDLGPRTSDLRPQTHIIAEVRGLRSEVRRIIKISFRITCELFIL